MTLSIHEVEMQRNQGINIALRKGNKRVLKMTLIDMKDAVEKESEGSYSSDKMR